MTDIITSRRSFLKLFGSAALVASAPIVPMLAPTVPIKLALPPNVLHVFENNVWNALMGVTGTDVTGTDIDPVPVHVHQGYRDQWKVVIRNLTRKVTFTGPGSVSLDTYGKFLKLMDRFDQRRFALSTQGTIFEFDALMTEWQCNEPRPDSPIAFNTTLEIVKDIKMVPT